MLPRTESRFRRLPSWNPTAGRMAYLSFSPGISTTELARRASGQQAAAVRAPGPRPAVFLDRDGTLVEDVGYPV